MFGFSLDSGQHPPELITIIEDVRNLESNNSIGYRQIKLNNIENPEKLKLEIKEASSKFDNNGYIYLLDQNNLILTGTFISNIKILKSEKNNISLGCFVWHQPKGYYKAWKIKLNNQVNTKNIWKSFEKDELQGWLVFALDNLNSESSQKDLKIEIDGNDFHNIDEFFCSLGEEINGIAGYFGRNIPALNDCMRGDFGVESIKELTWKNHQKSKELFKTKFNEILEIFKDFNVKINLQ